MPVLDHAGARTLLLRVVENLYSKRNSPLPGALVKAQMVAEAKLTGNEFNETSLGVRKFIDFIKTVPEIAIQGRSGSDVLLAPEKAGELLAAFATPLPRLRRDFWRAFIEFPVDGVSRIYDPNEDKVLYFEGTVLRSGIHIEPIDKSTQLEWRRTFADEQPDPIRENLLAALNTQESSMFNEFSRRLRENPSVMRAWNRYLQKQTTDYVAAWASKHAVSEERWLAAARPPRFSRANGEAAPTNPQTVSQRAELYNFLDQLPIEDLLQLRVPLDWVLKVTRRGNA
jgi:hypothetical protein